MKKFTDYTIVKKGDSDYPEKLLKIKGAPEKLYVRGNLPEQNKKTVSIVGARRSGSLITADYALEQGKTIFACPGRVGDSLSRGTNNLIKQGAYILTSAEDVLEHLGLIVDGIVPKVEKDISKLDYFEVRIYNTIKNEAIHIDQIVERVKLPVNKCLNILMSLELNGFAESLMNNYYRRVE